MTTTIRPAGPCAQAREHEAPAPERAAAVPDPGARCLVSVPSLGSTNADAQVAAITLKYRLIAALPAATAEGSRARWNSLSSEERQTLFVNVAPEFYTSDDAHHLVLAILAKRYLARQGWLFPRGAGSL